MSVNLNELNDLIDYNDFYNETMKIRKEEYSYHLKECYFVKDGKYYNVDEEELHPAEIDGTLPIPSRRPITLSHLSFAYKNLKTGELKEFTWVGKFRLLTYKQLNGTDLFCPLILQGCRSFDKTGFTIMGVRRFKIMSK